MQKASHSCLQRVENIQISESDTAAPIAIIAGSFQGQNALLMLASIFDALSISNPSTSIKAKLVQFRAKLFFDCQRQEMLHRQ
jgi:hypothetical protein